MLFYLLWFVTSSPNKTQVNGESCCLHMFPHESYVFHIFPYKKKMFFHTPFPYFHMFSISSVIFPSVFVVFSTKSRFFPHTFHHFPIIFSSFSHIFPYFPISFPHFPTFFHHFPLWKAPVSYESPRLLRLQLGGLIGHVTPGGATEGVVALNILVYSVYIWV